MISRMPRTLSIWPARGDPSDSRAVGEACGALNERTGGGDGTEGSARALSDPVILTLRPEARKSLTTSPPSSRPVTPSSNIEPKPLCTGIETFGPPDSTQSSSKPPSAVAFHFTSTAPDSEARAP